MHNYIGPYYFLSNILFDSEEGIETFKTDDQKKNYCSDIDHWRNNNRRNEYSKNLRKCWYSQCKYNNIIEKQNKTKKNFDVLSMHNISKTINKSNILLLSELVF